MNKELLQQKAEAVKDLEYSTLQTMLKDYARWNEELEKEIKELKEKVTELSVENKNLRTYLSDCIRKAQANESNY